jgi:hypothetical protein
MTHVTYLVIFHLKMIVCQNVNLPHIDGHHPQKTHLWYNNYQILHMAHKLFQSYGITMFNRYYIKTKNHFSHFWNIFAFFSTLQHIYFWHKYIVTSHHITLKSVIFLKFDLFGFWPTIICKNIVKILHKNDMVEVQTWDL